MIRVYGPGDLYPGSHDIFRPHSEAPTATLLETFLKEAPVLASKPAAGFGTPFYQTCRQSRLMASVALRRLGESPNTRWNVQASTRLHLGRSHFSFESITRNGAAVRTPMPLVPFGERDFLTTCPLGQRLALGGESRTPILTQVLFNGLNVVSGKIGAQFSDVAGHVISQNVLCMQPDRAVKIEGWRDWQVHGQARPFLPYPYFTNIDACVMGVFEVYTYELTPQGKVDYERALFENLLADLRFLNSPESKDWETLKEWHLARLKNPYPIPNPSQSEVGAYDSLEVPGSFSGDRIRRELQAIASEEESLLSLLQHRPNSLFDGAVLRSGVGTIDQYWPPMDTVRVGRDDVWVQGAPSARVYVVPPQTFEAWVGVSHQDALRSGVALIPPMTEPAPRPARNPVVPKAINPAVLPPIPSGFAPYSAHGVPRIPMGLAPIAAGANGVSSPNSGPDTDDDLGPYGHILAQVVPPSPFTETDPDLD